MRSSLTFLRSRLEAASRRVFGMIAPLRLAAEWWRLRREPLFDERFYQVVAMPERDRRWPARWHYLVKGRARGASTHPLFDAAWYRVEYPDVAAMGVDPTTHYLRSGRAEGRRPNAWLDPGWYRSVNGLTADADVVAHFLRYGGAGRDPSPSFACSAYLDQNPQVRTSGANPLAHFLTHDEAERRRLLMAMTRTAAPAVTEALIEERRRPRGGAEVALFVTHAPQGRLKPHVQVYLAALARQGLAVTLIVAADRGFVDDDGALLDLLDGLYVRENTGWDFAAWAHALRLNRELLRSQTLYLLNDSLIGPTSEDAFRALLARVREHHANIVGLTANRREGLHLQSFFLSVRAPALSHPAFLSFIYDVRSLADKDAVITNYEIAFSPAMAAAGLSTAAIFEPGDIGVDLTVFHWRELLDRGFTFVKASLLKRWETHNEVADVRAALAARGYAVDLLAPGETQQVPSTPPVKNATATPLPPQNMGGASRSKRPMQVTLIGPWNFENGLGVASRGYVSALLHTGYDVGFLPIEVPFANHARSAPTLVARDRVDPPDVAILHLNPDAWPALYSPSLRMHMEAARKRVAMIVWESNIVPDAFARGAEHADAIWAPSHFCAEAFQALGAPVKIVPYVVPVRKDADPFARREVRTDLGLAEAAGVVLYVFDASSYLSRKNPAALVRAFAQSGLSARGWRLLLKAKHLSLAGPEALALLDLVERTPGVGLIDRALSAAEARALLDACDVYASPHCSEGFGLTIAEAMAHGKVVTATDFGGSADFLDASCGLPVPGEKWELEGAAGPYAPGTVWARINEKGLAEALLAAADMGAEGRAALGAAARLRVADRLSPAAVAAQMRANLGSFIIEGAT